MEVVVSILSMFGIVALFTKTHGNELELRLLSLKIKNEFCVIFLFLLFLIFCVIYEICFISADTPLFDKILFYSSSSGIIFISSGLFYHQMFNTKPSIKKTFFKFRTSSVIKDEDVNNLMVELVESGAFNELYKLVQKLKPIIFYKVEKRTFVEHYGMFYWDSRGYYFDFGVFNNHLFMDFIKNKDIVLFLEIASFKYIEKLIEIFQKDLDFFKLFIEKQDSVNVYRTGGEYIENSKSVIQMCIDNDILRPIMLEKSNTVNVFFITDFLNATNYRIRSFIIIEDLKKVNHCIDSIVDSFCNEWKSLDAKFFFEHNFNESITFEQREFEIIKQCCKFLEFLIVKTKQLGPVVVDVINNKIDQDKTDSYQGFFDEDRSFIAFLEKIKVNCLDVVEKWKDVEEDSWEVNSFF